MRKKLKLLYSDGLLTRALAGEHNLTNRMTRAFEGAGFEVSIAADTALERMKLRASRAYSITHAAPPVDARSLVLRKAYVGAFWRLEATEKRWEFEVARAAYDPTRVDGAAAGRFFARWQKLLYGDAPKTARRDGFLFVPLQARLLDRRGFQTMAPVQMVEAVCAAQPNRQIITTLHPKAVYGRDERAALDRLRDRHANLVLSDAPYAKHLQRCHAVVCKNSATAFRGFFFGKPAMLFARIDFHHIAANVGALGVDAALRQVNGPPPDLARYVYWFLKENAIGAGGAMAEAQILAAARRGGWPV